MPQGMQMWDASGNLMLDVTDSLTRVLGMVNTDSAPGNSVSHPGFLTGRVWWFIFIRNFSGSPAYVHVEYDSNSNELKWLNVSGPVTIIYGVY